MNEKQVHKYVGRFLEATGCSIIEKSSAHYTVKLSPQADRELTNRPYYWGFVDRVGAEPETMTFLYVTDKKKYDEQKALTERGTAQTTGSNPASSNPSSVGDQAADAALVRSFGFVQNNLASGIRIPREDLYFGAGKLEGLFGAARTGGSYVCLFQEPERKGMDPYSSTPFTMWLGVNLKVEFCCDRKREEIYSFGVSMATGSCIEHFHQLLLSRKLSPRLPANVHVTKNGISFGKALSIMEQTLERKLKAQDYKWAEDASARLAEELERIDAYYKPLVENALEENKTAIEEQFRQRRSEIKWQYEPRVTASAINCGLFHLEGID